MSLWLVVFSPQAVFSSVFYFASVPLYQGFLIIGWDTSSEWWWLIKRVFGCLFSLAFPLLKLCWNARTGKSEIMLTLAYVSFHLIYFFTFVCCSYSTIYTMFPVFSLVLDKDVKSEVAMLYPELYKDLLKVFDCCCADTNTVSHRNVLLIWCFLLCVAHRVALCHSRRFWYGSL